MALLPTTYQACRHVALATMSYCAQVQQVLQILELATVMEGSRA
jgi:hypothetical protein